MEATKLDTIWKLGSIIVLFIGFCMIFYGIKQMDQEGKECISNPKHYTEKALEKATGSKYDCICRVIEKKEKPYFVLTPELEEKIKDGTN